MYCPRVEVEGGPELFDPAQLLHSRSEIDTLEFLTEVDILP
jgi:hypothetical protein